MARLTLKWRVLAYTAIVHVLVATASAIVLLLNAQYAVRAEITAAQNSAVTLIEQMASPAFAGNSDEAMLADFAERVVQPRHVQITIVPDEDTGVGAVEQPQMIDDDEDEEAPEWFLRLVAPEIATKRVPLIASDRTLGHVEVAALPDDEAAEVWEDVELLFLIWVTSTLVLLGLLLAAIGRALAPVKRMQSALRRLEAGDYSVSAGDTAMIDLKPIGQGIDRLNRTLRRAEHERNCLSRQLLDLRDSERKELARELHDELGPCLFGLTVAVDAVRQTPSDAVNGLEAIDQLVGRIRATNSRILNTLRPQTIGQLPLPEVIADLLADFKEQNPGVSIECTSCKIAPPIDETRDLSVYRVVQEAITNALRHGNATAIGVQISKESNGSEHLVIEVSDNGSGLRENWQEGRGLMGMRERLQTLGGALHLAPSDTNGVALVARIPNTFEGMRMAPTAERTEAPAT